MGSFLAGAVWLIQLMMNSWIKLNARYLFLFLGVIDPRHPGLAVNRSVLFAGSLALLVVSWALLRRQERYL
jgi:hypothetical protein